MVLRTSDATFREKVVMNEEYSEERS